MNRKWTIEVIADFKEKGKNDAIDFQVRKAGANLQAALYLIMDGIKPQVVAFSDDFFSGRSDFDLLLEQQPVQDGKDMFYSKAAGTHVDLNEDNSFSDDFMESLGKK